MTPTSGTDRIEKILAAVNGASRGDHPLRLAISEDNDLIDTLAAAVNKLTDRLSTVSHKQGDIPLLEKDRLLRPIFEQNPYPMWLSDAKGTLIHINQACCDMLNIQPDEVIGKYTILQDNIVTDQGYLPLVKSVFDEGKTVEFSIKYDSASLASLDLSQRKFVILDVTISPIIDGDGTITNAIIVHHDVTQAKQLEEELMRFRFSIERTNDAVFWLDRSGQITYVNEQACRSLGYSREELLYLSLWDIDPDFPAERWAITWEDDTKSGQQRLVHTLHRRKDGTFFPVEVSANYHKFNGKEHHVAFVRDITERKKAEQLLRESESQLKEAQQMARLGFWTWDIKSGDCEWSDETYGIFRLDPQEFTPRIDSIMALSPWPGDHERDQEIIRKAVDKREQGSYEQRFLRPDGSIGYYFSTFRGIFDENDNLVTMMGTVQDITERKQAEEELRKSEEKYRSVVDNIGIGIVLIDKKMQVLSANKAITRSFPDLDISQRPVCYEAFNFPPRQEPCSYCAAIKTLQDGAVHETLTETPTQEGVRNYRVITSPIKDSTGEVISVVEMAEDITEKVEFGKEKEKLEMQLLQAQKMEAVGTLAGGIAHDFNNMLSVIIGYAELLKGKLSNEESLLEDLAEIEKAAFRSRDTTRQLLAFSKQQAIVPRPINLIAHIQNLEKTLSRLIGEDMELRVQLEKDLWEINFDPSQIDQILINLAVNARDAMPDGGKITIEAKNVTLDDDYCLHHQEAMPGDYVLLEVSDNGFGMDKKTLSRAFDPFFSTKEVGKGTGLGLATVYGIVKQNEGLLEVYSEPGQGTTFKIYLSKIMAKEQPKEKSKEILADSAGETILLVEDDEMVRAMTKRMLERIGYNVLVAENSTTAQSLCRTNAASIDLLLTDVIMPEMNGADLRDRIVAMYPEIKVLFMSGYTATVISRHGVLDEGINFIQKPFSYHDLAQKVHDVLNKK